MRQTKLSVVLIKIASMVGVALCVIPFFTSVQAQSSSGQAQMLLEMQALRQEVAELRDMVERQQFALKKLQRQLQSKQPALVVPPVSDGQQVIQLNSEPLLGLPSGETLDLTNANESVSVQGSVNDVGSPSSDVLDSSTVSGGVEESKPKGGREYPPVVEISIGGSTPSANELGEAVVASSSLSNSVIDTQGVSSDERGLPVGDLLPSEDSLPVEGSLLGEGILQAKDLGSGAGQAVDSTLSEIKPIETVSAQPIVAVPSVPQGGQVPTTTQQIAALDPASVVDVVSENDYYQRGFALLKESKHTEAVAVFKQQITSYPKGERADDAYYWIAESMYVNRKLDVSKENFKAIIQGYPNSARLPDAMLKLAYIEQEQGNIIEARILLQEILQFHPKSDAALSAKNRLAEIK